MPRTKGAVNKAESKAEMKERLEAEVESLQQQVKDQQATIEALELQVKKQEAEVQEFNQWKERLKLGGRKELFTEAEKQTIKMYSLQGKSIRQIAKEFDCSVGKVHKVLHEAIE